MRAFIKITPAHQAVESSMIYSHMKSKSLAPATTIRPSFLMVRSAECSHTFRYPRCRSSRPDIPDIAGYSCPRYPGLLAGSQSTNKSAIARWQERILGLDIESCRRRSSCRCPRLSRISMAAGEVSELILTPLKVCAGVLIGAVCLAETLRSRCHDRRQ